MSREFNGNSPYDESSVYRSVSVAPPFTMFCWWKATAAHNDGAFMSMFAGGSRHCRIWWINTYKLKMELSGSILEKRLTSSILTLNVWRTLVAQVTSQKRYSFWVNNSKWSSTTDVGSIGALTRLGMGSTYFSATSQHNQAIGRTMWAAVWNTNLTDQEIQSLNAGLYPMLVRPENIVSFLPCGNLHPERDIDLADGTVWSIDPWSTYPQWSDDSPTGLIYPSQQLIGIPPTISAPIYNQRQIMIQNKRLILT